MSKTLALVHTAPSNIATFDQLIAELDPTIPVKHYIDESLLRDARAQGITGELAARIDRAILDAADDVTAVVLCTCSTIGGAAEQSIANGQRVIRVDRAMAERAVEIGDRIIVAAALESTIAPTTELIKEVAAQAGRTVTLLPLMCDGAWAYFEAGDPDGYVKSVAATLHTTELQGDVIVLAQASMAGAGALCDDLPTPVLSSPRLGLEAALAAYRAREKTSE
jgi:hypothetical protein